MLKILESQFNLNFEKNFSKSEILTYQNISDKIYLIVWSKDDKSEFFEDLKKDVQVLYSQFFANHDAETSFENLVKELNEKYANEDWLDIILALSSWNNLYLTQSWNAECYLIRNWRFNIILESLIWENDEQESLFENVAMWVFSDDDYVIFSDKRILKRFTAIEIVDFFEKWVSEWVEALKEVYENEEYSISLIWAHIKTKIQSSVWIWWNQDFVKKFLPFVLKKVEKCLDFAQNKIEDFIIFLSKKTGHSYEKVQKMFVLTVFLWFIFILITFISLSSQSEKFSKDVYEKYKIEVLKIEKNLDVAESRALMGSNIEANAILDKSESKLDVILEKWILREKALELLNKISKMRDEINKITRFDNLETKKMVDFSDFLWEWEVLKWMFKMNWFVFTYTENKIFKVAVNKVEKTINFIEWEKIRIIKSAPGMWLALVFSEWNILYTFNWKTFAKQEFVKNEKLKKFNDVETYSRFFYLLDNWQNWKKSTWTWEELVWNWGKWHVWKYWKKRKWFSLPFDSLKWEDLSTAIWIAIDWSVYILHKDWLISQYYSGKSVNFQYKWVSSIIKDAEKIYTKPNFSKIYLQDFKNNKIILIQKTKSWWEFLRQYIFEWEKIIDFKVDKNEQEMIIEWEKAIYKISLMGW